MFVLDCIKKGYHSAYTGLSTPTTALLIEQFDTLPTQLDTLNICTKEFGFKKLILRK